MNNYQRFELRWRLLVVSCIYSQYIVINIIYDINFNPITNLVVTNFMHSMVHFKSENLETRYFINKKKPGIHGIYQRRISSYYTYVNGNSLTFWEVLCYLNIYFQKAASKLCNNISYFIHFFIILEHSFKVKSLIS